MPGKLYIYGAIALLLLAGIGTIYAKGRMDAAHKAEVEELKGSLKHAIETADRERKARLADAILATENAKRKAALETKIGELDAYVESLEDRDRVCLDGRDTERLRDLWE